MSLDEQASMVADVVIDMLFTLTTLQGGGVKC